MREPRWWDDVVAPVRSLRPSEAVELTVTLQDVEPPLWRRLVVPASLTLAQTHEVLQTAMGWRGHHLHLFYVGGTQYGDVDDFGGPLGEEESFTLADARRVTASLTYEYDFGDGWTHEVDLGPLVPASSRVTPQLIDGARACPREDCGGPWGYQHLLEVLADPANPERPDPIEWLGGPSTPRLSISRHEREPGIVRRAQAPVVLRRELRTEAAGIRNGRVPGFVKGTVPGC